ncbi:MAG: ATP synthase F1 subunit epsilon [Candidatus Pacebacteria bacterium]|nr:ATP synthase F1 subunit epsilon [Candidatus Paceibacterota bacterium]MBP9851534.1 ATP synthase F1 subunit epsilon [Candidatus Paceibacterota bacterium]
MSTKQIKLKVVTPEKLILEELVDSVTVPTTEGEIGILPDHVPLVAGLKSGDIVANTNGEEVPMAVVGGFVEVNKVEGVTTVVILADFAEHVGELSDEAIERAHARAAELKKAMEDKEHVDFEHFESELERSITRIKIADKWRSKKYRK